MKALLLLALIVTCHGAGARIHREVHEQQKLVQAASYPSRRSFGNPTLMDRSLKTKSRVFRNAQVQVDEKDSDEPRLFRASGRFQKRVVAAAPHHDVTTVPPPTTTSDSSAMYAFSYDESSHHMNKMTEDNRIMEEAAEYAKGLERTTVAVRGDEEMRTTVPPPINSQNVPAIITPRAQADERRQQFKQPPPAFPQKPPIGRPQQDIFTNTVNTQTSAADPMLPPNRLMPTANALQNVYHPPAPIQASAPVIQPFTLPPPQQSPAPIFPGLITPQVAAQVPQGIASSHGSSLLQNSANPGAPQLNPMQQLPTGVHFPQGQMPSIPARRFVGPSQPPTQPALVLPAQPPLAGQIPPAQIINGQAANSSLEQLGCGFDWLTNTCKDVFGIGWCGQCHDFGNIFVHDCKCVRPLIALPPRQAPQSPQMLFRMI
ncbi:unnamed protein product [Haemonchus placei]|uniref:Uncharacterized protein n=1 Tax=Haemonchus placei TaxID=6290 RepID=A0A0N4WZP9_HAEPC|nr:unnamed protein product [Haemonchus placei]